MINFSRLILLLILFTASVALASNSDSAVHAKTYLDRALTRDDFESSSDPIVASTVITDTAVIAAREKAFNLHTRVHDENLIITSLNQLSYLQLPVGIQKQIGPLEYTIIFSSIESTPAGSFIEAYFMFEIPNTGDKIAFRGSKIPYSNENGFAGRGRLELLGDYHIVLNSSSLLTLAGNGKTFAEFDCDGFVGMQLDAVLEFSRDIIVPEDNWGKIIPAPTRVETRFTTAIQNWNDILIEINLPTFQVNGLKDVSFTVTNAALDWSDLMNPSGMVFPDGYVSPFIQTGQQSLWRGIYMKHIDVKLPKAFSKRDTSQRVAIGVENMLLDDQGFTGKVYAQNVLSSGNMSGWAFTIDKVSLDIVTNQVQGFEVSGKITVPELRNAKKDSIAAFNYLAHRGADNNFIFAISVPGEGVRFDAFAADVKLYNGSEFIVVERNDRFYPTAVLNGELTINATKAKFNDISFQGLRISTEEPKFDIQYVGFGNSGDQKVSNFPVVINGISVRKENNKFGIGVNLVVNVGGAPNEGGFGGGGEVIVWAKQENTDLKDAEGRVVGTDKEWKFDKLEVGAITINASKPNAFELSGTIQFFDGDQTYGDGFRGAISGTIGKVGGLTVQALFGNTGEFRYWYADALVKLPTRVPIIPGVVFANAFGGGFYYKMKQTDQRPSSNVVLTAQQETAVYYVPEKNSMGIKAIMQIESARKEAMNGVVMLELMMNRHGGINSVTLSGNAEFMSFAELATGQLKEIAGGAASGKLAEKLGNLAGGQVRGSMFLRFDNVNDVFHGNIEVFINVAGGLVKGVGANSRAGWAVIHFEKNDWYIHIGTPTDPIGLEVAKIFQAKSYFMLGKNLPGSPPPPSQVTEILGPVDLDYMRDMNALQSGAGFAFGLHFLVDTGDLTFLMFYGRFAAGTGVDFMLKDYGTAYHCQGSSGPFGINGWYANGQAYAFVMGKIGIKVKLKFYKGNFDIVSIGAAAVLQAKGPNPFWMKGTVGGYYSILGGMVKGNCRFEMEIGKKCVPVGEQNVLADQQMIAEISPASGADKVDVFSSPQVAFNIPVGEVFEIRDLENNLHYYRATLGRFEVLDGSEPLAGLLEWNGDKNVVIFKSHDIMPGEKSLKVRVGLAFEERKNGVWSKVVFQGSPVEEHREHSFRTDKAPDYIPGHNVLVSYPLNEQRNFYPLEYSKGIIKLKQGQPYLFTPGPEWNQKARMTKADGSSFVETAITYNASEKAVHFNIPTGFENSKVYSFELLNIPVQATIAIDANVRNVESQLEAEDEGSAILTTKELEGQLDRKEVKSLFEAKFRTSKYNTFVEKMNSIVIEASYRVDLDLNVFRLASYIHGDESFDDFELTGNGELTGIIKMEAVLEENLWYQDRVHPLIYESYPLLGWMELSNRNIDVLGLPPVRDVYLVKAQYPLTESPLVSFPFSKEYVAYNLARTVHADYRDLQNQAANYVADNPTRLTPRLSYLLTTPTPYVRYGDYKVRLNYVIPGIDRPHSSYEWVMFNSISDN